MKRSITSAEQKRINELLKARRERELTKVMSVSMQRERLSLYEAFEKETASGMTSIEEQHLQDAFLYPKLKK